MGLEGFLWSPAFDTKAYHDEYRERVIELIEEKSKGKTLKLSPKAARHATHVVDLMQRLKESVALPAQTSRESAKKAVAGRR